MKRMTVCVCCLLFGVVCLAGSAHAKLLMADTFDGNKLNPKFWEGQPKISWFIKKNALEIFRKAGDGNSPDDFGYGKIEFENFGLKLDFQLLDDPQPSKMELLFRAKEFNFYQLILNPVNGFGRKNSARWYKREGQDRGTWNEFIDFRAEVPFPLQTNIWYSLALLGKGFDFELYLKKREELLFQKVSAWTDAKQLHPKGTLGIHTNQLQHYFIDNVFLYDNPREVNLSVEPQGKLAVTWGRLKQR